MPRDTAEIDDGIDELRKQLRDSRIVFWLSVAGLIAGLSLESFLIYRAVIFTGRDADNWWAIAAVPIGLGVLVGGAFLIGLAVLARESIFAERRALTRSVENRRVVLAGGGNSRIAVLNRYKNDLPDVVEGFRLVARRYRRRHNFLQTVIVLGSLGVSAVIGLLGDTYLGRVVGASASALVAIAASFSAYFR